MPRYAIDKARQRDKLKPREAPYYGAPLARGLFVGFRKLDDASGTWLGRCRTDEGRQKYTTFGLVSPTNDYAAAAEKAATWAKAISNGYGESKIKSMAELCAARVANRRTVKGDKVADQLEKVFANHVLGHDIAKKPLGKLTTSDFIAWRAGLVGSKTGKPLGDDSKDWVFRKLKTALNFGITERAISIERRAEWKDIEPLGEDKRREVYLSREQRAALLDASPDYARAFLRASCLSPQRPGALAQCLVKHLDVRHKRLYIAKDKANANRWIPLTDAMLDLLKAQAKDKAPDEPLISFRDGSAWSCNRWGSIVKAARAVADLPAETCAYSLRHSVITDMVTGGLDPFTIADIAGTSVQQIQEHYFQAQHDLARDKMAALNL